MGEHDPRHDRKARLILNSVYSLLSWLAPLALGLVVTPIVLAHLGNEAFGVYLVLLGFISYSFSFNVGRTLAKYVSEFRATGRESKINDAVTSAFWLSLGIGLFGAVAIALIAKWLVTDLLQVSVEFRQTAEDALILGGFSIPATMIAQVFQSALQGLHRFGRVSLISNLNWLCLNAGNLILVVNGFGVVALLAWNLATAAVIAALSFVLARGYGSTYTPGISLTRDMFFSVSAYGFNIFLYQFFGVVLVLFERGWLLREFGAAVSGYYLVPMTLAIYMHGLIASVCLAAFPAVNELLTDRERLSMLYQKATKVTCVAAVFSVATVICIGREFLLLWLGSDFAQSAYTNLVFHFLSFGLIAAMIIIWQINEAQGAARLNALQVFVWGAVAIPLMVVTSGFWSAEGVAASRLLGVVVTIPMVFYCEKRFFGSVFWRFWASLVLKIGLAAASLAGVEVVIVSLADPSWYFLVLAAGAGSVVFAVVILLTRVVTADERDIIAGLFRRRFRAAT